MERHGRADNYLIVVPLLSRALSMSTRVEGTQDGEATMKIATAVLALAVTAIVSLPRSGAQMSQQSPEEGAVMERGRYLVETGAACGVCHTTRGPDGQLLPGMELAGGRIIVDRGFRAVVPNITPDPETGIGRWSEPTSRWQSGTGAGRMAR